MKEIRPLCVKASDHVTQTTVHVCGDWNVSKATEQVRRQCANKPNYFAAAIALCCLIGVKKRERTHNNHKNNEKKHHFWNIWQI